MSNLGGGAGGSAEDVTSLLSDWKAGRKEALDLLTPVVYDELRRLADHYIRGERQALTLQATAVVHEAWLRLAGQKSPDWESRAHFFGVASRLMRQILVDRARERRAAKRGSGAEKVSLDEALHGSGGSDRDVVALGDALDALAKFDERKCRVIELRFFGGLSLEETAQALDISVATVGREQRVAEAWLHKEMAKAPGE